MTTTPDEPIQPGLTPEPGATPEQTDQPDDDENPNAPDQDASANKVNADEIDEAATSDRDPAEGADEPDTED
jgi:hypothetical protein